MRNSLGFKPGKSGMGVYYPCTNVYKRVLPDINGKHTDNFFSSPQFCLVNSGKGIKTTP